ncbi:Not1-domain-containing protein [Delitschia confertaspora ATCC 74209]|uniref:General negative regulator of transcription subunit 1 n=1 Tax=Delitschia confertaspora ATCC 74209 TaxID=1513339 RepID=A0A9P4MQ41_9PLEO|nr:Not1-domain-containing protein [Delitschia confertaspora ATCC 74209]
MSQQSPWGSARQHHNARLTPISTAFSQDQRNTPSPNGSRAGFSPSNNFPSLPPPSTRHATSRKSSASSTSRPFSPSSHTGQQPPTSQLLSSRTRTIAPQPTSQLASSAAALPTASQGGGGASSSGGGATKLARASPSLSQSSTVGSPSTTSNPNSSSIPAGQNLSRIVIAQIFLLLSQFGPIKDDRDRTKWDTQTDQIRKLVESNGMEVFSKYFRRLLQNNAAQVFPTPGRNAEPNGSYAMLVTEVQKIRQDPQQAPKIAEAIDSHDGGDIFRDFDLSTFMAHFKLDPVAKTTLALAFKTASRADLRTKADAILSNNYQEFIRTISSPNLNEPDDLPPAFLAAIIERLLMEPPRDWNEDNTTHLVYALQSRYTSLGLPIPTEVHSVLFLPDLTDASHNPLVKIVQRAGPKATASVEACKDMLSSVETRDISYQQVAMAILFMAITQNGQAYNAKNFVSALREHRAGQRIDWQDIVHAFDRAGLVVTKPQFLVIYYTLLSLTKEYPNLDIQLLWGGAWQHDMTQLYFLMALLSCTIDELDASQIPHLRPAFTTRMFQGASEEVRAHAAQAAKHPYVSLDAITALFNMIFQSQESYHAAQTLGIPDRIINPHTDLFIVSAAGVPKPWGPLQETALKQLFTPYFKKQLPSYNFVLYGLWQQDTQWLVDRFVDAWHADPSSLTLILEHAEANGWLETLIRSNNDVSLDLAAQAHARGLFEIEPWLQQTLDQLGPAFLRPLALFVSSKASDEMQSLRDDHTQIGLPLAVKTVHPILWFLTACGVSEAELLPLQRTCIQAYPRLINYGEGVDEIIDANGNNGNALPEEADKKMQEHFKLMYSNENDVRDILTILKTYKSSHDPAEQDLFACMVHGLFDEYNCFGEYPLEALATTAVLFGGIIQYNLLSRIALQVALAMVLEAVQEYAPNDSMYKFGLQALLHFKERLPEWPSYCEQLLNIPGLQGTEIWQKAEDVVGQIEQLNGETQNGIGIPNGTSMDESLQLGPAVQEFSCLHVDPPVRGDLYEEPDEDVQDKVLFVLNNVSERNLQDKTRDLTETLQDRHHQWFAGYLVEQRAKMQPNFQQLYLDMLDLFNDRILWEEVLRETYVAVIRMLNSESTDKSSTERTQLKNLGSWLGSLTLARDKPIKFRNISFKDLLIEGHDTDRLLIVIPFTCKVLVQAARSTVFRPPNPWLMEILGVLIELYHFADLKLNQKFEIEVLCKGLDLDHKEIEPSDSIRARPQGDEEFLGPIVPEGMETFPGDLSLISLNRARGASERFSPAAITAALPDFSSQLRYPPMGGNAAAQSALKKIFHNATTQAIQEIIAPVVERSVTIAAISTTQLVLKDFAMEGDENKLRDAAHTVVKSLSGSLALVTCKEPLRMSIMNNIRLSARDLPEQALPEGHVLMFVNDNLDTVCTLVEQAAEVHSVAEIDAQVEDAVRMRRMWHSTRPDEPFKDPNPNLMHPHGYAFWIPEPYKLAVGGLNREQLAIYEEFGRQARGVHQNANNTSQDNRQVPDVLQDQFTAVPSLPTPAEAPAVPRQTTQLPRLQTLQSAHIQPAQQQLNGYMEPSAPEQGLRQIDEMFADLLHAAKDAPEEHVDEIRPSNPVHQLFDRLLTAVEYAGIQKDTLAYRVAGSVTNALFAEPLRRLVVEVLAQLLASVCQCSAQTSRQVLIWFSAIQDDDRVFNPTVMICLMNVGLMDFHRLNIVMAKAIQQRRVAAVEMLSALMDEVLLNEHPSALRADFALSVDALTTWLAEDPSLEIGKEVMSKLQVVPSAEENLTPPVTAKKDQLEYYFEEWVHLQHPDMPRKPIISFIYQLHQNGAVKTQEDAIQFIRACVDASVASHEHHDPYGGGNPDEATVSVDALAKLIISLVVFQEEEANATAESKAKFLDRMLAVVVIVLNHHHESRGDRFNQKVYFRLFSTMLFELHRESKSDVLSAYKDDMFLVMAKAFLALQPAIVGRFQFSWLTLISHRVFIPAMLEENEQDGTNKDKRWDMYAQLIEALLRWTGELIKPTGQTIWAQNFYRGVLRVLLVIHHDYPEFLAENHFRFCNSIPTHCTQLRNLIVSAYPSNILEMPDPFTTGLQVDRLENIRQAPNVRADIDQFLCRAGIKDTIDSLLKASDLKNDAMEKVCNAIYYAEPRPAGFELMPTTADASLIHAVVLYIGSAALSTQGSKGQIFNPASPSTKLLERLVKELRPEARFHLISAVANQLRWPNAHTQYFSYALLHLFGPPEDDAQTLEVQETITRVLLERLLVHRPHPWGLIITLLEILKNTTYAFWDIPFVKANPEVFSIPYQSVRATTNLYLSGRTTVQRSVLPRSSAESPPYRLAMINLHPHGIYIEELLLSAATWITAGIRSLTQPITNI